MAFNPVNKQVAEQLRLLNAELKQTRTTMQTISRESKELVSSEAVKRSEDLKKNLEKVKDTTHAITAGQMYFVQQIQAGLSWTKQFAREAVSAGGGFWQGAQGLQMQTGQNSRGFGRSIYQATQNNYNIATTDEITKYMSHSIKLSKDWRKEMNENLKLAQQIQKMTFGDVTLVDAGKIVESMAKQLHIGTTEMRSRYATALTEGRNLGLGPTDVFEAVGKQSFASRALKINEQQVTRLQKLQEIAANQGVNIDQNQLINDLYLNPTLVQTLGINRGKYGSPNPEQILKDLGAQDRFKTATMHPSALVPMTGILPANVQDAIYFYYNNKNELGKPVGKQKAGVFDKFFKESDTSMTTIANTGMKWTGVQAYSSWEAINTESAIKENLFQTVKGNKYLETIATEAVNLGRLIGPITIAIGLIGGTWTAVKGLAGPGAKVFNWGKGLLSKAPAVAEGLEASMSSAALSPLAALGILWDAPGMKKLRSKDFMEQMMYGKTGKTPDTGDGPGEDFSGFNIMNSLSLRAKPLLNKETKTFSDFSQEQEIPLDTGSLSKWGLLPGVAQYAAKILGKFPGAYISSGYRTKDTVPGPGVSLHTKHRGIDISGPKIGKKGGYGLLDLVLGQAVANYGASFPGMQEVIFNRRIWSPKKGWHNYTGSNPHYDHVHLGFGSGITDAGGPTLGSGFNFSGRSTIFGTTGDHLLGQKTAAGITLTPTTMGAAIPMDMGKRSPHTMGSGVPYYPIKGGKTSVTINYKGKMLTVPVIDIGPATWTHNMIDLTPATARALGFNPGDNPNLSYTINPPAMAEGGIIKKPTLVVAGEAGPEAIVPLGKGSGGIGTHLHGNIYMQVSLADGGMNSANQLMRNLETILSKDQESLRDF